MQRSFRKQTHADFSARIARIDPYHARHGRSRGLDRVARRTIPNAVCGFGIAYVVLAIAGNRPHLEHSLAQGSLPVQHHATVLLGLTVFLAVACAGLLLHLSLAAFARGGRRHNARCLLTGALAAFVLTQTPTDAWQFGQGLLDDASHGVLTAMADRVGDRLPRFDIGVVQRVSGAGL